MLKLQFKDRRREAVWLVDHIFSIGKHPRNSMMVDNSGVEDFHIELVNQNDSLKLINKAGGVGVWVNGMPIAEETQLKANDQIKIGELELELVDPKQHMTLSGSSADQKKPWAISSKASWLEKNHYDITDKIVIGRDSSCDIVLPLEHLSRQHVELEVRKGQLYVKDLDSANGTFLNGERISEAAANAGDKLKIDVVTFEISGPTHDPQKTIIRTLKSTKKTKLKAEQNIGAHASVQPGQANSPIGGNRAQGKRKNLVADGKQDWIGKGQTEPETKSSKNGIVFVAIGLLLLVAAAGAILSQNF